MIVDISTDQILSVINRKPESKQFLRKIIPVSGIRLEANRAVFFKGRHFYGPNPASNMETPMSPLVEISNISLNAAEEWTCRLSETDGQDKAINGSLRVRLKSDNNKYKIISVKSAGIANIQ